MHWLLLLLLLFAPGIASAQSYTQQCPGDVTSTTCDQGEAFQDCYAYTQSITVSGKPRTMCVKESPESTAWRGKRCLDNGTSCSLYALHAWKTSCLTARPPMYAGYQGTTEKVCFKGCEMGPDPQPTEVTRVDAPPSNSVNFQRGRWVPTGNGCSTDMPGVPPPRDDYCTDLPGGYQMCRNSKGQQCVVSAKTGRKYCAKNTDPMQATNPERTENVTKSPEAPAPGIPSTPPTPRPNEDWRKSAEVSVTNVTNNTTTNTTINGNGGTPNTNPGAGAPGDGSDNPGESGGGDDEGEDDGQASGGTDCAAPPACSGNALACYAIEHNWRISCDGVGDGIPAVQAFDQAVNEATEEDAADMGAIVGQDGNGDLAQHRLVKKLDAAQFDDSGFLGAGQCPALPMPAVAGHPLPIDLTKICELLGNISHLVMAFAYYLGFRLIAGGGSK